MSDFAGTVRALPGKLEERANRFVSGLGVRDKIEAFSGMLDGRVDGVPGGDGLRERVRALYEGLGGRLSRVSPWYGVDGDAADGPTGSIGRLRALVGKLDEQAIALMSRYAIVLLRLSLGVTFVWFGALKVVESSPVGDLVANTVYWFPPEVFVPILGAWEIAVGLGLITGLALRTTLLFFLMQMAGTFLVLVIKPDVAFQGNNPLLLTTEGEFVVKNLILISGGLVVGSTLSRRQAQSAKNEPETASAPENAG